MNSCIIPVLAISVLLVYCTLKIARSTLCGLGLVFVIGDILAENQGMQEVCKKLGFRLQYSLEDQVVRVELAL